MIKINSGDNYTVYVHINKVNGKMYVGITSQVPEARWRKDGSGYKRCPVFFRAIQKYGWDSFEHFIFSSGITKDEAENAERLLIAKLETQNGLFGYNIKEGGDTSSLTEEIKNKISATHLGSLNPMYGRRHTEEEKEHLRELMSGENNPRFGVRLTDETKQKISQSLTGRHLSDEHKKKISEFNKGRFKGRPRPEGGGKPPIPILCVETGIVYESINEAVRSIGSSKGVLRECLKNKNKTAAGYHWEKYQPFIS